MTKRWSSTRSADGQTKRAASKSARRIVCEEWQQAVREFDLTPGSVTEKVVGRIINRLDEAVTDGEVVGK